MTKKLGLGLLLIYICTYLFPLGSRPLGIPDEMRYAEIPREMVSSGDYVTPRLNGLSYFEKPALGYWAGALSMKAFGESPFSVRLPSALAVGLAALAVFLMMRRETDEQLAMLSAFLFLCSGLVYFVGTFAVLDSLFSGFSTLAMCCFFAATRISGRGGRISMLLLAGVGVGLAFLTKGFIAGAVPVVVIIPYLLWERHWKDLFRLPWLPLIGFLVVSLPWCIAIARREPDFWNYFFWHEHINRYFSKETAQHSEPFWFFIPIFIGSLVPWSIIAPMPLREAVKNRTKEPLFRFCVLWLIMPFLFFSASSGKLGTYILPCFPPFAILLAMGLVDLKKSSKLKYDKAIRSGILIFALPVLAVALVALVAALGFYKMLAPYDSHMMLRLMGALFLSLAVLFGLFKTWRAGGWNKIVGLGLCVMAMFTGAQVITPMGIDRDTGIQIFLESKLDLITPDTVLVADVRTASSLCFLTKRSDAFIYHSSGELTYGINQPDASHRYLGSEELDVLLGDNEKRIFVVLDRGSSHILKETTNSTPIEQGKWNKLWYGVYEPAEPSISF